MPYEEHHIAGRRNSSKTVRVCVDCHRHITNRQIALGVPLEGTDAEDKKRAALVIGYLLLLGVMCDIYARTLAETCGLEADPRAGYRD
ncbi:hypothetical protein ACPCTO_03285 [Streptomyces olivoreticuli]